MKPKITLTWDGEQCVTKYSNEFVEADWVVRVDMLQDAIKDLQDLYKSQLPMLGDKP
jgi:hypothetical protein